MKPFSKFEAISGKPVVTREGKKVTQLKEFELSGPYQIVGVVEGHNDTVTKWTDDGSFYIGHVECVMDLFMESAVVEGWVAFGPEATQTSYGLIAFASNTQLATALAPTEEKAIESYKDAYFNHEPKGTVRISWEE
jgi:hypothetical protein